MTSLGLLQYSEINESPPINNLTEIEKKRQARHNITIKKRANKNDTANDNESGNTNVESMLKLINNTNGYEDYDGSDGLADFNPPPRAEVSSKIQQSRANGSQGGAAAAGSAGAGEAGKNIDIDYEKPSKIIPNSELFTPDDINNAAAKAIKPRQYPVPLDTQEGFNSLPKTYASDYYKQYVPYFNQVGSQSSNVSNKDQLLEKLNYMIHLLEEQRSEKTGHVMEEVILYSFLGVFIIFIVDSFARAGKYTR